MIEIFYFLIFIAFAYGIGYFLESSHYASIKEREKRFLSLAAISTKTLPAEQADVQQARLVYGSAVISIDYFKRILAGLRNIFGGKIASYETLIDRARREAILRMKESAPEADTIVNLRIETSMIGQAADRRSGLGSIEALAYGTAITFIKHNHRQAASSEQPAAL